MFDDPHLNVNWYPKPHLNLSFEVDGKYVSVNGTFRHKNCALFSSSSDSFFDLCCSLCSRIWLDQDFRMCVVCEDHALEKHGTRDIDKARKL